MRAWLSLAVVLASACGGESSEPLLTWSIVSASLGATSCAQAGARDVDWIFSQARGQTVQHGYPCSEGSARVVLPAAEYLSVYASLRPTQRSTASAPTRWSLRASFASASRYPNPNGHPRDALVPLPRNFALAS
jgi:hypothetical protein